MVSEFSVQTRGQGLYEITEALRGVLRKAKLGEGLCTVFIRHTSASLVIQENADPSAKRDLEAWLNRLVPELTRHMVEKIFATDLEDWPALLRATRETGDEFRQGKVHSVLEASSVRLRD